MSQDGGKGSANIGQGVTRPSHYECETETPQIEKGPEWAPSRLQRATGLRALVVGPPQYA